MLFSTQPRLKERALDDVAMISVPASLKSGRYLGYDEEFTRRRPFQFSQTDFWASFLSYTRYKQLMVISIMASDASDGDYAALPRAINMLYAKRKTGKPSALGTGTLIMTEGLYASSLEGEPAVEYVYFDKARRLQIAWHALKKEVDVPTALATIERMAASFQLRRDPAASFAEARARPAKEAAARAAKRALATAMLQREGYPSLVPGKPVLRNGVYLEWMDDPEPRYQLFVPLGRVRAAANGSKVNRPRPAFYSGDAKAPPMAGTLGWREISDEGWAFHNQDDDYLPLPGIASVLAAQQQDRAFVYFYYIATVRVEETDDDRVLSSLRWFLDGVPEVQRLWRAGTLVTPGTPEKD
jgi:hypothetical protein